MKMLKMKVTVLQPNNKGVNLPMVVMRHLSLSPQREADDFMSWVMERRKREKMKERKKKESEFC